MHCNTEIHCKTLFVCYLCMHPSWLRILGCQERRRALQKPFAHPRRSIAASGTLTFASFWCREGSASWKCLQFGQLCTFGGARTWLIYCDREQATNMKRNRKYSPLLTYNDDAWHKDVVLKWQQQIEKRCTQMQKNILTSVFVCCLCMRLSWLRILRSQERRGKNPQNICTSMSFNCC